MPALETSPKTRPHYLLDSKGQKMIDHIQFPVDTPPRLTSLQEETTRYSGTLALITNGMAGAGMGAASLDAAYGVREQAQLAIHIANRMMCAHPWDSPVRLAAQAALDAVMVELYQAKWSLGRYDHTYMDFVAPSDDVDLNDVLRQLISVTERAVEIAAACTDSVVLPAPAGPSLESKGTEILFAGDVPLVPSICPVVVLSGSNYDMGRQYAQQIIEIFGSWVFERLAQRPITDEDRIVLERWTAQLRDEMPEVLEFARGWSEGAQAKGVPLTIEQATAIWTGYRPPATRHLLFGEDLDTPVDGLGTRSYLAGGAGRLAAAGDYPDRCSGVAAWGNATADGKLVAASTTDHECTWQATIVAFPEKGNNFIYTPFSVNGSTPVLGRQFMAGHPGFNNKGVAYVEHGGSGFGGAACGGGPLEEWGYGIRRGAATFHALQFADSAVEAREMQLKLPVGDPGPILGTAGGFYADSEYGVVIEERAGSPVQPDPILREASYDTAGKAYEFLTATNTAVSRNTGSWRRQDANYQYSLEGGWYLARTEDACTDDPVLMASRMATKNSAARNRQLYRAMMAGYGRINGEYMKATYRESGTMPEGSYEDVVTAWRNGEEWGSSAAHRGNAFTAVIEPDAQGAGAYHACIGPAAREVQVREPSHGYYYYDETNTFWTLRLAHTPLALMNLAEEEALRRISRAQELVEKLPADHTGRPLQVSLLEKASAALDTGRSRVLKEPAEGDERLSDVAFRTRAFTRAQVRASQILESLVRCDGMNHSVSV